MIPTIRIVSGDRPEGWVLINAADFDPALHQVFGGERPPGLTPDALALENMTLAELRNLAGDRKIPGRTKMSREQLIEALTDEL